MLNYYLFPRYIFIDGIVCEFFFFYMYVKTELHSNAFQLL